MSYSIRLAPALLVSFTLATLAACSGATTSTEGTSSPSTATAATGQGTAAVLTAPVAPQATGHARMIADALSSVPLRDDQRADIEKMAAESTQRHQAAATAHAQIATTLAAQIESGTLDRAALQPSIDAAVTAASAARPLDRAAMEHLHAILTPEQRGQFVDALEASGKAHFKAGGHAAHMEEWATDLKLTDDQRAQIAALLKNLHGAEHRDHDAMHAHGPGGANGKGFMESFRGDTLAPTMAPADADMHTRANEHADKLFAMIQQVLPLLTPEQRSLAAAKIRSHADSLDAMGGPSPE